MQSQFIQRKIFRVGIRCDISNLDEGEYTPKLRVLKLRLIFNSHRATRALHTYFSS